MIIIRYIAMFTNFALVSLLTLGIEILRQQEIDRVLEEAKEEERQMREFQKAEIKNSWDDAVAEKKKIAAKPEPFLDPLEAGPSAAQNFAGADPFRKDRIKEQKEQMRKWVQEQISEKSEIKTNANQADKAYSDMLNAVEQIRESADKEEKEMREYLKNEVKTSNAALKAARIERTMNEDADFKSLSPAEKAMAASLNLHDNEDIAMDANGRIVRKDQFRGYSAAQVRRIIQDNEALLAFKREKAANEGDDADVWLTQQALQQQAMEQAHAAEQEMRLKETEFNLQVLKQQIELQKQRREGARTGKFGAIEPGYFDKFGMGCR